MSTTPSERAALREVGGAISDAAWELALEVVDEARREHAVPSLERLGRSEQLGDMPTFIRELGHEVAEPDPVHLHGGTPATLVREHAREREALGFTPREIVTEFLLLRRVLWRFVTRSSVLRDTGEVLLLERCLNNTVDRLVAECVVAYFDRATAELALRARLDPLTELLNHQAFMRELVDELDRGRRYGHPVALLFFDVDRFKDVNDTYGHPEGDRVLQTLARVMTDTKRGSDLAGRMGGDEFALALVESDAPAATRFLERLVRRIDDGAERGEFPTRLAISPGIAIFPVEEECPDALFRLADRRLYEAKRAKALT